MKKKLALLLVAAISVTTLLTACGGSDKKSTETESGTSASTETTESSTTSDSKVEDVDLADLYVKGKYEGKDLSEYLILGDYAGIITLEESDYVVTKEEIQAEIDAYREGYGTTEEVKDRAVQEGDIVNIDYVGRIYGIKFVGGTSSDYDLKIGSDTFIAGFEDGLIGAKIGETLDVKATFPEDYEPDPELAGKEAVFTVTVNSISVPVLAEYNDELVEEITDGIYTTVDEFNVQIESQLKKEKAAAILKDFLEALQKRTTFTEKMPEAINEKYEELVDYYKSYASSYGYTLEKMAIAMGFKSEQELRDVLKEDAQAEVYNSMMLYAYGYAIGFNLEDAQVLTVAEEITKLYGYDKVEELLAEYGTENLRAEAYAELIADAIVENYK